ncbi:MAG: inositol monophosphatase family protein [Actinomycetota bacterium]
MKELLDVAERAARSAGSLLIERFKAPASGVDSKSTRTDLVSDADRDSERLIMQIIGAERPDDAILAEESGSHDGSTGLRWVIDPLDGTINFLHGIPQWCVSIACEDQDGGVVAALYDACRDEMFTAHRSSGAYLNGARLACSSLDDPARAIVATGFGYDPKDRKAWSSVITELLPQVADVRRAGSAALDIAWTACGRVDVYAEIPCRPWDRAAGLLIASEAGCEFSFLEPLSGGREGEGVLCAPPALYDRVRSMISAARS